MELDVSWKTYFRDDERYADIINGVGCGGQQLVTKEDLQEADTQTFLGNLYRRRKGIGGRSAEKPARVRMRDMVRKAAFGVNFAIVGIENQELVDYSIPLRCMVYDVGEYEKQADKVRKALRKQKRGLHAGEYLYGFGKESRLYPVVTFILYGGGAYQSMEEDAYEVAAKYVRAEELIQVKEDYRGKDGKVDMCQALKGLIEDGRMEGRAEGHTTAIRSVVVNMVKKGRTDEEIVELTECSMELIWEVRENLEQVV